MTFIAMYLFLGLLAYLLIRLTDGPQGFGGFIGYTLTGQITVAIMFCIVVVAVGFEGLAWIGRRL